MNLRIQNSHVSLEVQAMAAAIAACSFRLADGRDVAPLFLAPWRDSTDDRLRNAPPLMRHFGSDWVCVPFGTPGVRGGLPGDWSAADTPDWDGWIHGYAANHAWRMETRGDDAITAELAYPESSPIERVVRRISLDPSAPAVHCTLAIHARREARLPVGLHPVFDLAGCPAGSCTLEVPTGARAWTFPIDVEPGRSRFRPDQRDVDPRAVATADGPADLARVPFAGATEDLVLLTGLDGRIALSRPDLGCVVNLVWDASRLPNCILWFSNGGRDAFPWNGTTRAIGIEPTAAAFDLGIAHSLSTETPLARAGVETAIRVTPETPWTVDYRIEVAGLA